MQKKYFITIVDNTTFTSQNLVRDEYTIDDTVKKELGGYGNLTRAMTSGKNVSKEHFCQTGTTNDGSKSYSIICVALGSLKDLVHDKLQSIESDLSELRDDDDSPELQDLHRSVSEYITSHIGR